MKETKLTIKINKTIPEIIAFSLNPQNTPLWVDSIVKEEVNEQPIRIGSIYRNQNHEGKWSEYILNDLSGNSFEMTAKDQNYHVRYSLTEVSPTISELKFFEWVENGELVTPFTIEELGKLKQAIEK